MKQHKHNKRVFDVLSETVKRDHAKSVISTVSEFGLIEMTRQRTRKSLESVVYQTCPYCQGKGLVKSPATMAILALRKVKKMIQKIRKGTILVFAHPHVVSFLLNENRQSINYIENKYRSKILVRPKADLHLEELKIEAE